MIVELRAEIRLVRMEIATLTAEGKAGLTITALAKKLGVHPKTVGRMGLPKTRGRISWETIRKYKLLT